MRKALQYFIFCLLSLSSVATNAQIAPGKWYFPPAFQGGGVKNLTRMGDKIYIHSGLNLFSYNPSTKESVNFTPGVNQNGIGITAIYPSADEKNIIVTYKDASFDIIDATGKNTHVSAIRDAQISGNREIRDVAFIGTTAYIATDFGLVVVDCKTGKVTESGQYRGSQSDDKVPSGGPISLAVVGNKMMALFDNKKLYESTPADKSHTYREVEKFVYISDPDKNSSAIYPVDANTLLLTVETKDSKNQRIKPLSLIKLSASGSPKIESLNINQSLTASPWTDTSTLYLITDVGNIAKISNVGATTVSSIPTDVKSYTVAASSKSGKNGWIATPDGVYNYDFSVKPAKRISGPYRPNVRSVMNVSRMTPSVDGKHIFVYTRSNSDGVITGSGAVSEPLKKELGSTSGYGYWTPGFIDVIADGNAENATPSVDDKYLSVSNKTSALTNTRITRNRYGNILVAPNAVAQNPTNPSQIWVATDNEGLYRITDGKADAVFSGHIDGCPVPQYDNMPAVNQFGQLIYDIAFDSQGNLWALVDNFTKVQTPPANPQLIMLPAAKVSAPFASIKKSDWVTQVTKDKLIMPADMNVQLDGGMLVFKHKKVIAVKGKFTSNNLFLLRYTNTPGNLNDSEGIMFSSVTDQDGNTIDLQFINAMAEDPRGQLVVASRNGLFVIANPDKFKPAKDRVRRLKVNNNDNTGTATYLLNGVDISAIDFDSSGRMWVATEGSGISVISSQYNAIEEQYDTDNSPLPSNNVSTLALDPQTNKVYVGGAWGLGVFASTQSPGKDDYKNLRAYPNPVRPEFDDYVTVDGLMNGSLVKVVDAQGNLIASGKSQGGTFRWNLKDMYGSPVSGGVYYIAPSQNEDTSGPKGTVGAKLLVIR